jgi:hypothetical protein
MNACSEESEDATIFTIRRVTVSEKHTDIDREVVAYADDDGYFGFACFTVICFVGGGTIIPP